LSITEAEAFDNCKNFTTKIKVCGIKHTSWTANGEELSITEACFVLIFVNKKIKENS
jgi:hypothetical protein